VRRPISGDPLRDEWKDERRARTYEIAVSGISASAAAAGQQEDGHDCHEPLHTASFSDGSNR